MKANSVLRLSIAFLAGLAALPNPASAQVRSPFGTQIREFGGATLKSQNWLQAADYPRKALSEELQGRVILSFAITAEGRAQNCVVEVSSGHPILDEVPCQLLERRARFAAARENGVARATKGRMSVDFWLPD